MPYLVDTNVLLRSVDLDHSMNEDAVNALDFLRSQRETLHIIPQNLIEFWNVYTRPLESNGLGYTPAEAEAEVDRAACAQRNRLKGLFSLLPDSPTIYSSWERLVVSYGVRGANVHDARLVAAMLVHGLTHILTFNTRDFTRYTEITTVHPTSVSSQQT